MTDYFDRFDTQVVTGELVDEFDDDGAWDPHYGNVSTTTRPSISYVDHTGLQLPPDVMDRHLRRGRQGREIASIIDNWSQQLARESQPVNQSLDVFNRNRGFLGKVDTHTVMARCAWAVETDDVLSTTADVVEGLMYQKCRFNLVDKDQESFWNQWAGTVNLDVQLRKQGREVFKVSQVYVGLWWADKSYTVEDDKIQDELKKLEAEKAQADFEAQNEEREKMIALNANNPDFVAPGEIPEPVAKGPGRGNRSRRKTFNVDVPTAMTIFEPNKVVPVGMLMFGMERFAYAADEGEDKAFQKAIGAEVFDGLVLNLVEKRYVPTETEKTHCSNVGVDWNRLWLLKKDACFRHTLTRSDYERYAAVRMKAALPILEMKDHLRTSDRASLVGNTNFIVVITKGTDKLPAKPAEIANLQEQSRVIARLPVLVGDHRLHVEIVSPSIDNTLSDARWQVLDGRLVHIALRTFAPVTQGGNSSGAGVSEMSLVVANGLMNRRHMQLRSIEEHVFARILERNEKTLTESPSLEFSPKRITLDFNAEIVTAILKLRDRGDISRETMLSEFDIDQDVEVLRRALEIARYDKTFNSGTPYASPMTQPFNPGQPGAPGAGMLPPQPAPAPKSNVGPAGQPRTEGGRPKGATDKQPRKTAAKKTAAKKTASAKTTSR